MTGDWKPVPLPRPKLLAGDIVFVDLEASGLGPGSWPIEVGLAKLHADGSISIDVSLVRPHPTWDETCWNLESAQVHNIPRATLDRAEDPAEVALWVHHLIGDSLAVSDAPEFDGRWLAKLFATRDPAPHVRLWDFDQAVAEAFTRQAVERVYRSLDATPAPHRAGDDAARLARAWRAGLTP